MAAEPSPCIPMSSILAPRRMAGKGAPFSQEIRAICELCFWWSLADCESASLVLTDSGVVFWWWAGVARGDVDWEDVTNHNAHPRSLLRGCRAVPRSFHASDVSCNAVWPSERGTSYESPHEQLSQASQQQETTETSAHDPISAPQILEPRAMMNASDPLSVVAAAPARTARRLSLRRPPSSDNADTMVQSWAAYKNFGLNDALVVSRNTANRSESQAVLAPICAISQTPTSATLTLTRLWSSYTNPLTVFTFAGRPTRGLLDRGNQQHQLPEIGER